MSQSYTHFLIAASKAYRPTPQSVCHFLEQLIQSGAVGSDHRIMDVPCNTLVRVRQSAAAAANRRGKGKGKRGGPRRPPWLRVDAWTAQQPAAQWQRIEVRPGEKGPLVVEVLHASVETKSKSQERLTVIRTVESQPKTHYTLSNAAAGVSVEEIAWAHDDRHRVEDMFALGNGEVGLDHYEVRSWVGWHHHMTLSMLALWFLVQERQRVGEKNSGHHRASSAADIQPLAPATAAHRGENRKNHHRCSAA
jgi:hypothetical protein